MMNSYNEGLLTEEYILKRLVYVNSANHAYSEILLDEHLAMFGGNNVGKTASLAGTKLLLFPEVNFSYCEKKFKFVGEYGPFSMEDSYEFYFPDSKSFIALEVQNPEGLFCMILYKTNNYTYGRFFIPLAYNDVRSIFWSIENNDFSEDLSVNKLKQFVVKHDGLQTNDPAQIRQLMFESIRGDKKQKRFCVVPMKDARPDSIEAFRNIYQLAFDTKSSEKNTLPTAIATLLEMGRGRDEERLNANLLGIANEYTELVHRQKELTALKNASSLYDRINSEFQSLLTTSNRYSGLYYAARDLLHKAKSDYLPKKKLVEEQHQACLQKKQEIELKVQELNSDLNSNASQITYIRDLFQRQTVRLNGIKKRFHETGFSTIDEALINLDKQKEELTSTLAAYTEESGVKTLLEGEIKRKNHLINVIKEAQIYLEQQESSLAYKLADNHSSSVIESLNSNLAKIIAPISETEIQVVRDFTKLFGVDGAGALTFLSQPIQGTRYNLFIPQNSLEKTRQELHSVSKELNTLDKRIQTHRSALVNNDVSSLIGEVNQRLKDTNDLIDDIRGMYQIERNIADTARDIEKKEQYIASQSIQFEECQNLLSKVTGEWRILQSSIDDLSEQHRNFEFYEKQLQLAVQSCEVNSQYSAMDEDIELAGKWFESIHELSIECNKLKGRVQNQLYSLLHSVPIKGVDPHQHYTTVHELSFVFDAYATEYATLDYDINEHSNKIRSHNQFVGNQVNELRTSKQFLTNYINEINADLNHKHVSNLSEIKLNPTVNKRFESLLLTLDKQDILDDSLLESSFYEALTKFVDVYFDKKTRRLKMSDIIESINYEYTLEETGERVTKSQSGGTTSTITAFVLSVLLNKITPKYVSLKMPIIVDEISTLDFKNTQATIQQISDHGFSIFCATPSFSGFISQKVGRWVLMDRSKAKNPRVSKCHINILPTHIETFGKLVDET